MTRQSPAQIIEFMPKPGRRLATPTDYKEIVALRIRFAREGAELKVPDIAKMLTKAMGRKITADTYRKWETVSSSIPLDAILPFCDITKTHPYQLLAKPSSDELALLASAPRTEASAA